MVDILQFTHENFQDGIRVKVVQVESTTTIWVRMESKPIISEMLTSTMEAHPMGYWPKRKDLEPGKFAAVEVNFQGTLIWARAILLEETDTGFYMHLTDFGQIVHQYVTMIRLLPQMFENIVPWARKIRLLGVREQENQTMMHHAIQIAMMDRTGILMNIDPSPGEAMTARLLLDWHPAEPPVDIGAHWLNLGYLDPA